MSHGVSPLLFRDRDCGFFEEQFESSEEAAARASCLLLRVPHVVLPVLFQVLKRQVTVEEQASSSVCTVQTLVSACPLLLTGSATLNMALFLHSLFQKFHLKRYSIYRSVI